jgi:hypothetical protein
MIKEYCDVCKKEIKRNYISERFCAELGDMEIEIIVAYQHTWNNGHICKSCLLDVVNKGKENKSRKS